MTTTTTDCQLPSIYSCPSLGSLATFNQMISMLSDFSHLGVAGIHEHTEGVCCGLFQGQGKLCNWLVSAPLPAALLLYCTVGSVARNYGRGVGTHEGSQRDVITLCTGASSQPLKEKNAILSLLITTAIDKDVSPRNPLFFRPVSLLGSSESAIAKTIQHQ